MVSWLGAKAAFGMIPRKVWIGLGIAVAVGLLVWWALSWHAGKVEDFGNERYQAGSDARDAEITALQNEINQKNTEIAALLRSKHNEEIRRIAADADALRLRGPGKAACASSAVLSTAAGGRDAAGRPADAAVAELHSEQWEPLVGLPFPSTVSFAEQHDGFRTEALSWRAWHFQFTTEWEAYRAKAEAVAADR